MNAPALSVNIPVVINESKLVFVFSDRFYLKNGIDSEKHSHSFFEVHFFTEGQGIMSIESGAEAEFAPDTLLIIPPEVNHVQKHASGRLSKYNFKFSAAHIGVGDDVLAPLLQLIEKQGFLCIKNLGEFSDVLASVKTELNEKRRGYESLTANLLSAMMIRLSRRCEGGFETANMAAAKKESVPVETAKVIDYFFDQNYNRNAKIEELCSQVHLSASQLSRTVKTMYGMTFKEKHTQTRLNYVRHLLGGGELSVKQISEMCGFESASAFSNFFKRHEKVSPQEYRKQTKV